MTPDQFRTITYVKEPNGIVTLSFNLPRIKNALTILSFYEVFCAVEDFERDDSAHVMILTGAKDPASSDPTKEAYSSGGYFSLDVMEGLPAELVQQLDTTDLSQKRVAMRCFQCEKPILAAINGLVMGAGYTLTLAAADQIYMSEHAWIELPFARLGVSPELGSSFLLPQLLGLHRAKQIIYEGGRIHAERAEQLQLVSKVLPHEELLPYTREKALQLVPPLGATLSIRATRKLLHEPFIEALSHALDLENEALQKLFATADSKEGIAARVERRKAVYTGR